MKLQNYYKLLNDNNLFKTLSDTQKQELLNISSRVVTYKKNKIVYMENGKCLTLDLLLKGELVVQDISKSGNVVSLKHIKKGETVGANLLFGSFNVYPMTFLAKTDVAILKINKNTILDLCRTNSQFLQEFLALVSNQAVFLAQKIKTLHRKSLRVYIVDFLKEQYHVQQSRVIKLPFTKKELAEKFGVQRSSLSRELLKMKKEGLIEYDAHSITILKFS